MSLWGKLAEETESILNWALVGLREYRKHGLKPPKKVLEARESYAIESDPFTMFFDECAEIKTGAKIEKGEAFKRYKVWCEKNEFRPISHSKFTRCLTKKGVGSDRDQYKRFYVNIYIKSKGGFNEFI